MDCNFLYSINNEKVFIKLTGDVKYSYSNIFSDFIDNVFSCDKHNDIIIDLTETLYIDSTNLGLLAKISRLQNRRNQKKVTIISDKKNINDVLESMGFDMVFILIKSAEVNADSYKEIENLSSLDDRETAKLMLDAHKELADVNSNNKNTFKDVINFLEKDLGVSS